VDENICLALRGQGRMVWLSEDMNWRPLPRVTVTPSPTAFTPATALKRFFFKPTDCLVQEFLLEEFEGGDEDVGEKAQCDVGYQGVEPSGARWAMALVFKG